MKITKNFGEYIITLENTKEAVEFYSSLNRYQCPEYQYDIVEVEYGEYPLEIRREDEHLIYEEDFDEFIQKYKDVLDALKDGESVTIRQGKDK